MGRKPSERSVPPCFAIYGAIEGDLILKRRYECGRPLIVRWRAISGVYCGKPRGPRSTQKRATKPKTRYYAPTVPEKISWYDGEEDTLNELFRSRGLHRLVIDD